jgi:hypothetical protein
MSPLTIVSCTENMDNIRTVKFQNPVILFSLVDSYNEVRFVIFINVFYVYRPSELSYRSNISCTSFIIRVCLQRDSVMDTRTVVVPSLQEP